MTMLAGVAGRARLRRLVVAGGVLALLAAPLAVKRFRGRVAEAYAPARAELVQTVVATGRIATLARVEVASLISGRVAEIAVREGDRVSRGQVLVRLHDDEARTGLDQSRAAVAQARAALAQAQASLVAAEARRDRLARTDGPVAAESVRIAEAEVEAARRSHERVRGLVEKGMVARAELDEARRALETAEGRLAREKMLAEATRPGGGEDRVVEAAVSQARAGVALAEAAQAQAAAAQMEAAARLAHTVIEAPGDGTVISRTAEEGDIVQPGSPLLGISRPGRMEVVAPVDEKNLALLTVGNRASVSADAYPEDSFAAVLSTIVPAVTASSGTVTARFAVVQPPPYLLPDMTVSVEVEVARRQAALSLPTDAVRDLANSPWVMAVRAGRAVRVPVRIGVRGAGRVEVLSGLGDADLVLPASEGKIAAGEKVRVNVRREG